MLHAAQHRPIHELAIYSIRISSSHCQVTHHDMMLRWYKSFDLLNVDKSRGRRFLHRIIPTINSCTSGDYQSVKPLVWVNSSSCRITELVFRQIECHIKILLHFAFLSPSRGCSRVWRRLYAAHFNLHSSRNGIHVISTNLPPNHNSARELKLRHWLLGIWIIWIIYLMMGQPAKFVCLAGHSPANLTRYFKYSG